MHLTALFSRRIWLSVCVLVFLAACSPKYDWRDVAGDSGALLIFPGKPTTATRDVDLAGQSVNMTMQVARVDDLSFSLAWADLPPAGAAAVDAATARSNALAALRATLTRNFSGQVVSTPVSVARADRAAPALTGEGLVITGAADGTPMVMNARLVGDGSRVWQLAVYGPQKSMSRPSAREAVDTFLLSVRIN